MHRSALRVLLVEVVIMVRYDWYDMLLDEESDGTGLLDQVHWSDFPADEPDEYSLTLG